jgi:hypothetical protein
MERDDRQNGSPTQIAGSREPQRASRPAPGKVTRTSKLSPSRAPAVQRKALATGIEGTPRQSRSLWDLTTDPWMDAAHRGGVAFAERGPVQARGSMDAENPDSVHRSAAAGVGGAGGALPHLDRIQEAFGGAHDLGQVRAHVGGQAAAAGAQMGAEAYATGNQIAFRSQPDLHTAAHEAAHVVQQRAGVQLQGGVGQAGDTHERHADEVADRVVQGKSSEDLLARYGGGTSEATAVQMRRLPPNVAALLTDPADPTATAPNFDANAEGMVLLLQRAAAELTPDELARVQAGMRGGLGWLEFLGLPASEVLTRASNALLAVRPDLTLGDPNLIDTGPRSGTADEANLTRLVANTKVVFDAIIAGSHDTSVGQVFGAGNIATAKAKYRRGRLWMQRLERRDKIVTDRSGYSEEVALGGLTGFHDQIALSPDVIDNPDDAESIITLIHESLHAGNADVEDNGYIHQPSFTELTEDEKLTNAAHFEVVPRRILGASLPSTARPSSPPGPRPAASRPRRSPLRKKPSGARPRRCGPPGPLA